MLAQLTYSIGDQHPDILSELDSVRFVHSVQDEDGQVVPEGSRGTILAMHDAGKAYTVEVMEPVYTLVTVHAEALRSIPGETRDDLIKSSPWF